MAFFRARTCLQSWVAAMAAYAVALQMLLTGVPAAQGKAAAGQSDRFTICKGSGETPRGGHGQSPIDHSSCVLCVASTPLAVPPDAQPVVFRSDAGVGAAWIARSPVIADRPHTPRSAQGPPQA
jgi:hypothetical protein